MSREPEIGPWFFDNSLNHRHPHLDTSFHMRQPLIGIGAPARMFLQAVADALQTELILPEHYPVANALGAVAGTVMVTEEILVCPEMDQAGMEVLGYYTQSGDGRERFEELAPAMTRARELARERALGGALRSGADNPEVAVVETSDGLDTYRVARTSHGQTQAGDAERS